MTLDAFLEHVAARRPLDTPEIGAFMNEMSDRARRITCAMNGAYHSQEELRELMGRLLGHPVDPTFRLFPPFHTDFGRNIRIGRNVFINAGCHFQDHGGVTLGDGTLVGHNVDSPRLNHDLDPTRRAATTPAPNVVGRNVWVGSNATILQGVTIGDGAVVAAGAVVVRDVEPCTIVGGVPARLIRRIELPAAE